MADVSASNGSDGSSLTVSGPRPLCENEPRPTIRTQGRPPAPRADSAAVRTTRPESRARRSAVSPLRGPQDNKSPWQVECEWTGGNATPKCHQ